MCKVSFADNSETVGHTGIARLCCSQRTARTRIDCLLLARGSPRLFRRGRMSQQKQPLQHGRDWPVSSWEACLLFGTILGLGDEVESQLQQCCTAEQREQFSRLPVDHTLFLIRDCCYQMLANCRRAKELVEQRSTD